MAFTNTSKLEAVNSMLAVIGESPITTLSGTLGVDASAAVSTLDEVGREVQMMGWHFNTDYNVEYTPDESTNEIVLAADILAVDVEPPFNTGGRVDVVIRGGKLYDRVARSFEFTGTIKATVVKGFDFEDLPQEARHYIMIKAGRKLQDRFVGSTKLHQLGLRDELDALATLKSREAKQADHSIFDNLDTYDIVGRRNPLRFGRRRP